MADLAVTQRQAKRMIDRLSAVALPVIFVLPLALTLVWGPFFADSAYDALRYAQNVAAARPFAYDALVSGYSRPLHSPLFVLLLALLAWLGLPLVGSSLVLGGLGWGVTAVLLTRVGNAWQRSVAGWLAAALLVVHPIILVTAGTVTGWVTAVFLLLLWLIGQPALVSRRGVWGRSIALALLPWLWADLSTAVLALLLWIWLWRRQKQVPWLEAAGLGGGLLLVIGALRLWDVPLAWPGAPLATWLPVVQDLLQTSEFFWLYVPLVLLGLVFAHRSGAVRVGLVWAVTAVLSGSYLAVSATGIFFLLLVGLGVEDFGRWLLAAGRVRPDVSDTQFLWGLGVVALLFVGAAHLGYVWTSYQFRPVVQSSVETVTAVWITENSQPDETVFASRRVAFLADRPLLPGSVSQIDPLKAGQVIAPLVSQPPDFVVTLRTIGWEFVTQTSWFRERYRSRQRFASPLATNTPIDVWMYEPSLFDRGETRPIQVSTNEGIDLVAYRYWPTEIMPGDGLYVTLFWQATQPVSQNFETIVRVISPITGEAFAQVSETTPRSIPANWWETGALIEERVVLTTTEQIAYGAYQLNLSILKPNEAQFANLYQNNDTNALDRVLLGYTTVPWRDGVAETAVPVQANFADLMRLAGVVVNGRIAPGETITVDLYWEVLQTPPENYVVFVHLLNASNEQVSGDDRQPVDGRFPTEGWQPGQIVKDSHPLFLPDAPGDGPFRINVGVYLPESGERLPVWDVNGVEQPERSITLPPEAIP